MILIIRFVSKLPIQFQYTCIIKIKKFFQGYSYSEKNDMWENVHMGILIIL